MPFVPATLADQLWGLCKPRSRRRPAISCLISISASRFSLQILPTLYGGPFDRRWGDDGYWLLMQVLAVNAIHQAATMDFISLRLSRTTTMSTHGIMLPQQQKACCTVRG